TYTARLVASDAVVFGPENWSITGAGPIELNTMVPASTSVSYSGAVLLAPTSDQIINNDNLLPKHGHTTQSLGSPSAPWNATLDALTVQGSVTLLAASVPPSVLNGVTGSGSAVLATAPTLSAKNLNGVLFADQFTGSDLGAKINAAFTALAGTPGEVWVNQNAGTTLTTAVTI